MPPIRGCLCQLGKVYLRPLSISAASTLAHVRLAARSMQFTLIDRITDLQPGASIRAVKVLSLAEEYLQDHFPRFPVMPGVLMLEAMLQAGTWLVYLTENFRHSTVILKEARNVKFAGFVRPGETLTVSAEIVSDEGNLTHLTAQGMIGDTMAVSGRLVLERFNVGERQPHLRGRDELARAEMRQRFARLYRPSAGS
jgi:3-hydroxyacyl-[acyl-carrier-protein] dehydratase